MNHRIRQRTAIAILALLHFYPSTTTLTAKLASAQSLIGPNYVSPTIATSCWVPCATTPNSNVAVPTTQCKQFYVCRDGKVINRLACSEGKAYDGRIGACNYAALVECVDPTCVPTTPPTRFPSVDPTIGPTEFPTVSPTEFPTTVPTASPSQSPTETPTESPSESPTISPTITPSYTVSYILSKRTLIEQRVLQSRSATNGKFHPSVKYAFDDFMDGLRRMGVDGFGADFRFSLWDEDDVRFKYGLVNVAAFLSQAMEESMRDDTCDELNWQEVAGRHAISNSCGQEGRTYQEETCGIFSCTVDPSMEVTAISSGNQVRAPPPFECRPGGGGPGSYAGYWDTYAGSEIKSTPYSNTAGRIDLEGCCYWGRGALLTRGNCNIGKLNYYLGARAARDGRTSIYPDIDFCLDPEATCASSLTKELRWTTALFEWAERVQRYEVKGWTYEEQLIKFYDEGMYDDSFIDSVGRIFSRGCHAAYCSDLEVRAAHRRKSNFFLILNDVFAMDFIVSPAKLASPRPVGAPASVPSYHVRPHNVASGPAPLPVDPIALRPITPPPSTTTFGQYPTVPNPTVLDPTVSNPTITAAPATEPPPIFVTPRPNGRMPIAQRFNNTVSNGKKSVPTHYPTALETIIVLVPNGVDRSALLHPWHAMASFCASAILLAVV